MSGLPLLVCFYQLLPYRITSYNVCYTKLLRKALGAAWYLPEERQLTTTEQILDEMCSTLAGRAAEEIEFGKISTGALNDLEKVTKQAYAMVTYYGMSEKMGNISYFDSTGQNEYGFTKPYSEETAKAIDAEVSKIIDTQYKSVITSYSIHYTKLYDFDFVKTDENRVLAGKYLDNPYKNDSTVLQEGKRLFGIYCWHCHGEKGDGKGYLYTSGKYTFPPANLLSDKIVNNPDGEIFHVISVGFGVMGAHQGQIRMEDRRNNFV